MFNHFGLIITLSRVSRDNHYLEDKDNFMRYKISGLRLTFQTWNWKSILLSSMIKTFLKSRCNFGLNNQRPKPCFILYRIIRFDVNCIRYALQPREMSRCRINMPDSNTYNICVCVWCEYLFIGFIQCTVGCDSYTNVNICVSEFLYIGFVLWDLNGWMVIAFLTVLCLYFCLEI